MSAPQATPYQLDADCELPPHLLQLFLRAAPKQFAELVSLCEQREAETARAQAHKLKGSLYAAGASRLAENLETLRGQLSRGDWPAVSSELVPMGQAFASVIAQLQQAAGASK